MEELNGVSSEIRYKVEEAEGRGRYLVATQDIPSGSAVISREHPILVSSNTILPVPACFSCNFPLANGKTKCSQCTMPMCESNCQNSQLHIEDCKVLSHFINEQYKVSMMEEDFEDFDLLAPLKALVRMKQSKEVNESIHKMQTNREVKASQPDWNRVTDMAERMEKIVKDGVCSTLEIENLICALDCNTYQVLCPRTTASLCALYQKATLLNHSCKSNTRPVFDRNHLVTVVATENISAGSEITTSYLTPFQTTPRRRAALFKGKCFRCNCQRCSDPTEFGSFSSALSCASCKSDYLLPIDPLDQGSHWKCQGCEMFLEADQALKLDSLLAVESMKVNRDNLDSLHKYLDTYQRHLHPNHAFLTQLKMWMCEGYGHLPEVQSKHMSVEQWATKEKHSRDVVKAIANIEPELSLINGLIHLELCDALLHMPPTEEINKEIQKILETLQKIFAYEDSKTPEGASALFRLEDMQQRFKERKP